MWFILFLAFLGQGLCHADLPKFTIDLHTIDVLRFPYVEMTFSIVDPKGRAVVDLSSRNFALQENLRRARIEEVTMDQTPLSVVLLLDRSGSMYDAIEHLKMAARKFVQLLEPQDQVMLIDFSDEPKILCPFTNERMKLEACLRTLRAWGPTALYDSIYRSVLEVSEKDGRRVVVVLTDGTDQNEQRTAHLSRHTLKECIQRAKKEKVPLFTIGLGRFVSKPELESMAKHTGGASFFAPTAAQLQALYIIVARNLKSRVRLVYRSPEQRRDGKWREIALRCQVGGAPAGLAEEKYRAPGRYVLETAGQGWHHMKEDELSRALPKVVLRDHKLRQLKEGEPKDLHDWLRTIYWRGEGEPPKELGVKPTKVAPTPKATPVGPPVTPKPPPPGLPRNPTTPPGVVKPTAKPPTAPPTDLPLDLDDDDEPLDIDDL